MILITEAEPETCNRSATQKYIGMNYATAREMVEAIALAAKVSSSAEAHRHDDGDRVTSGEPDRTDFCHVHSNY